MNTLPSSIDDAIDFLIEFYKDSIGEIESMSEEEFLTSSHFGAGLYIRNTWYLWWTEGHKFAEWPKSKPKLVEYFNSIGIDHADDMSHSILLSFYRHLASTKNS